MFWYLDLDMSPRAYAMHSVWQLFQCSLLTTLLIHFFYVYLTFEIFSGDSAQVAKCMRNRPVMTNFPIQDDLKLPASFLRGYI